MSNLLNLKNGFSYLQDTHDWITTSGQNFVTPILEQILNAINSENVIFKNQPLTLSILTKSSCKSCNISQTQSVNILISITTPSES